MKHLILLISKTELIDFLQNNEMMTKKRRTEINNLAFPIPRLGHGEFLFTDDIELTFPRNEVRFISMFVSAIPTEIDITLE